MIAFIILAVGLVVFFFAYPYIDQWLIRQAKIDQRVSDIVRRHGPGHES